MSNLTSNAISKFGKKISEEGAVRAGERFTLFLLNKDINYINKINN